MENAQIKTATNFNIGSSTRKLDSFNITTNNSTFSIDDNTNNNKISLNTNDSIEANMPNNSIFQLDSSSINLTTSNVINVIATNNDIITKASNIYFGNSDSPLSTYHICASDSDKKETLNMLYESQGFSVIQKYNNTETNRINLYNYSNDSIGIAISTAKNFLAEAEENIILRNNKSNYPYLSIEENKIEIEVPSTPPGFISADGTPNKKSSKISLDVSDNSVSLDGEEIKTLAKVITSGNIYPSVTDELNIGSSDYKYNNIYGNNFSGNAASATKLETARKINGTDFDGTQDITTEKWGTERIISISSAAGTTGTAINGGNAATLIIPSTMTGFASVTSTSFIGALNGNATSATKVNNVLKFGSQIYNGSEEKTITAADFGLSNAMHFIGIATVAIEDGSATDPGINGYTTKAAGDVIIDQDSSFEYVWANGKWERLGVDSGWKVLQTTVSSPSASGSTTAFIDTISQNENGVISVTKKNLDTSGTWSGTATKAAQDSAGQQINTTYIKGMSISGTTITYTKGDNTTGTITTQDTTQDFIKIVDLNDSIDTNKWELVGYTNINSGTLTKADSQKTSQDSTYIPGLFKSGYEVYKQSGNDYLLITASNYSYSDTDENTYYYLNSIAKLKAVYKHK